MHDIAGQVYGPKYAFWDIRDLCDTLEQVQGFWEFKDLYGTSE